MYNKKKFFIEWEMFQIKVVEKTRTYIHTSYVQLHFLILAVYEIMWNHFVEPDRLNMTI